MLHNKLIMLVSVLCLSTGTIFVLFQDGGGGGGGSCDVSKTGNSATTIFLFVGPTMH